MARPMPRVPPVMMATRPVRSKNLAMSAASTPSVWLGGPPRVEPLLELGRGQVALGALDVEQELQRPTHVGPRRQVEVAHHVVAVDAGTFGRPAILVGQLGDAPFEIVD